MMGLLIGIHVAACALLIIIILIQRGRGGGLVEGFSGVESMFGTKTSAFLTRATTVLSTLFFFTCLSLAFLSAKQSKSLMRNVATTQEAVQQAETAPQSGQVINQTQQALPVEKTSDVQKTSPVKGSGPQMPVTPGLTKPRIPEEDKKTE